MHLYTYDLYIINNLLEKASGIKQHQARITQIKHLYIFRRHYNILVYSVLVNGNEISMKHAYIMCPYMPLCRLITHNQLPCPHVITVSSKLKTYPRKCSQDDVVKTALTKY